MKKWCVICAVVMAVSIGVQLLAEETSKGEVVLKKSRLLEISGTLSLDTIWQDLDIGDFLTAGSYRKNAAFTDPTLTLDMKFSLKEQMSAFIQLRTPYYLDDYLGARPIELTGTIDYPSRTLEISQLYLEARDFLSKYTTLRLGVQEVRYQMTETHGAFLLGIGESEDPFAGMVYGNWPMDRSTASKPAVYSNRFSFNQRAPGSVEAGGLVLSVRPTVPPAASQVSFESQIDLIAMTVLETKYMNQDRDVLGIVGQLWYPKKTESQVAAMLALTSFGMNANSRIYTFGGGLNWKAMKGLEVYGEAYGQTGEFYEGFVRPPAGDDYYWLSSRDGTIKQLAFAGYGGVRYAPGVTEKDYKGWGFFFDVSYWWISGDKNPHDLRNQDFIAYEDIDSTLIIEEDRYGFDLDTNYKATKLCVGFTPARDFKFLVLGAVFERARDYTAKDKIGTEVDVVGKWNYGEALTFKFGFGVVANSHYVLDTLRKTFAQGLFEVVLKF